MPITQCCLRCHGTFDGQDDEELCDHCKGVVAALDFDTPLLEIPEEFAGIEGDFSMAELMEDREETLMRY